MNKLALAAVFLVTPLAARAELGLRIGGDAQVAYHNGAGTNVITDNWPLGLDVMLSYWLPTSLVSIDLEVSEQFQLSPPNIPGVNAGKRTGTVLRPGVRVSPPVLPIYLRGAIPINVESPDPYDKGRGTYGLMLGAGLTVPFVLFKLYLEGDANFPLGGGTNAPDAFSNWSFALNAGLDFRF